MMPKFPETFGPYFENMQSLFLYKNNIKLVFLEWSFQCVTILYFCQGYWWVLKEFKLLFKVLLVNF